MLLNSTTIPRVLLHSLFFYKNRRTKLTRSKPSNYWACVSYNWRPWKHWYACIAYNYFVHSVHTTSKSVLYPWWWLLFAHDMVNERSNVWKWTGGCSIVIIRSQLHIHHWCVNKWLELLTYKTKMGRKDRKKLCAWTNCNCQNNQWINQKTIYCITRSGFHPRKCTQIFIVMRRTNWQSGFCL